MAIAYSSSISTYAGSGTTLTVSLNNATGDFLLAGVANNTGTDGNLTGVTYNGVALTKINSVLKTAANAFYFSNWYLVAPATGANNLVATRTNAGDFYLGGSTYSGVDQTTPIDNGGANYNTTTQGGGFTTFTQTITTVSDNCWVFTLVGSDYGGLTASTGSTLRGTVQNTFFGMFDNNAAKTPAGSVSLTQNVSNNGSNKEVACTVAFQPTGGGSSFTPTPMLHMLQMAGGIV